MDEFFNNDHHSDRDYYIPKLIIDIQIIDLLLDTKQAFDSKKN